MSTAVAIRSEQTRAVALKTDYDLRDFLTARQGEFALIAKASGVEAEVLVAELVGAARKNPQIMDCAPESIVTFMYDSAKTGLVIGKGCFAVPVKKRGVLNLECWIGYVGAREVVKYAGAARDIYAYVVFDGDPFEEILGTFSEIRHRPGPNRGKMEKAIGVYAVAVISQTIHRHLYLSRADIQKLRDMNRGDTTRSDSPWVTNEEQMWQAKVILKLCKTLPANPRLAARMAHALALMDRDEAPEAPPEVTAVAAPIPAAEPKAGTPDTGEAATDKQIDHIKNLAQSHHWSEKQRAGLIKRADSATKALAMEIIDGAQAFIKEKDEHERKANEQPMGTQAGDAGDADDLPF